MTTIEIAGIILIIIVALVFIRITGNQKLIRGIKQSWGKYPKYEFSQPPKEKYLHKAFEILKKHNKDKNFIDDITWNDLDMLSIFHKINHTKSSVGAEALYYRLRTIKKDKEDQDYFQSLHKLFDENQDLRRKVQYAFVHLGRFEDNEVLSFLDSEIIEKKSGIVKHLIMGLTPLLSLVLILFKVKSIGLPLLLVSLTGNMLYTTSRKYEFEKEFQKINYLLKFFHTGRMIRQLKFPLKEDIEDLLPKFEKYRLLSLSTMANMSNDMELLSYYINMVLMIPFISYSLVIKDIKKYRKEIIRLWYLIGDIDACIAVLSYKTAIVNYCNPEFIEEKKISGQGLYHPLIENPVPNPVSWTDNTLVSGSNASGKSTYVKSIAINAIFAQTIYLALAEEFQLKAGAVLSSMAIKDNVLEGDSYFMAEIKSLKRIVEDVEVSENSYYFIDEILKGTNTLERIAASASIIEYFIERGCLSFVATHDIELTKIFEDRVDNIHFRESFTEDNALTFDYKVYPGPSKTKNAIKLLEVIEFPQEIVTDAQDRLKSFQENESWTDY